MGRITAHRMATTGRIGSLGAYSSGLDPGITALTDSMAMSTTATILITATSDPTRRAGRSRSNISKQTRPMTDKATRAIPVMMGRTNMLLDIRAEVTLVEAVTLVAEVTTRESFQSSSRARFSKRALLARFELAA
jgi:hypothetical protein